MLKSPPAAFSHRSDPQRAEEGLSDIGITDGLFRSLRSILGANGPYEGRYVPPRLFTCCSLARLPFCASWGSLLLFCHTCGPSKFSRANIIVLPQPGNGSVKSNQPHAT